MWAQDIAGSRAHAQMLVATGVLSADDGRAIADGLQRIEAEFRDGTFDVQPSDEDIHTAVERRLTELVGDAGRRLHTGRSRNDQVATDVLLYLRDAVDAQRVALTALAQVLLDQAERHLDTLLPGYTHLQRAQPVRLAHHLLAYVQMLIRDQRRFGWVREHALAESPLGSGALSGRRVPDRPPAHGRRARLRPARRANSLDSVATRDALADYLHAAATLCVHLSRGWVRSWCCGRARRSASWSSRTPLRPGPRCFPRRRILTPPSSRVPRQAGSSPTTPGLQTLLAKLPAGLQQRPAGWTSISCSTR